MFLISGYLIFIIVKNARQIMPLARTAKETPRVPAKLPEIKLPKGIIPAKVSINTLITLPRNSSLTFVCNIVFIRATAITLEPPVNIKAIMDNRYVFDKENNINENENTKEDTRRSLPLYLKSPKRANINAPIKAPNPALDISTPSP